jgi:growth arrest-specific protein 8
MFHVLFTRLYNPNPARTRKRLVPTKGSQRCERTFLTFLGNYIPQVLSNAGGEVDYDDEGALGTKVRELEKQKADEEQQKTHSKLERDRVHSLFKIAKREIVDKESVARNKDKMVEGFDELHQEELSAYKHKVKHLLQERESCFSSLKTDTANALKLQHRRAKVRQENLNKEKCTLKTESKEEELAHEEIVQQLKLDHAKEITKIRQEFAMARVDMDKKHESDVKTLHKDFELRIKHEVYEVEERKNCQINSLTKAHNVAFTELKNYYNDITHNNLDLIKTLKDELADMKKKEAANDILMFDITEENKRMAHPLTRALQEVQELRRAIAQQGKDMQSLGQAKNRILDAKKMFQNLEKEHNLQGRRLAKAQSERDELCTKFELMVYDMQQKSGLKNLLVQRRLDVVGETTKRRDAELGEMLNSLSLNPEALHHVSMKLNEVLTSKSQVISTLQSDNLKLSKAYNDLMLVYRAKMNAFGVQIEELGVSNDAVMSDPSSFANRS